MQYCIKRFFKKVGAISTYGLWEPPCRDSLLHTPLVLSSALTICLVETPTCCDHQPFMLMLTWIPLPSPVLIHFDSQFIWDFGLWMKNYYSLGSSWALRLLLLQSNRGADLDPECKNTPNLLTCCQHEFKKLFYADLFSPKVSTACYTGDFRFKLSNSVISSYSVRNSLIAKLYSSEPALVWQDGFLVVIFTLNVHNAQTPLQFVFHREG